jgi:hypothetical protein
MMDVKAAPCEFPYNFLGNPAVILDKENRPPFQKRG